MSVYYAYLLFRASGIRACGFGLVGFWLMTFGLVYVSPIRDSDNQTTIEDIINNDN